MNKMTLVGLCQPDLAVALEPDAAGEHILSDTKIFLLETKKNIISRRLRNEYLCPLWRVAPFVGR